jgi:hypothetical protein
MGRRFESCRAHHLTLASNFTVRLTRSQHQHFGVVPIAVPALVKVLPAIDGGKCVRFARLLSPPIFHELKRPSRAEISPDHVSA